MLKHLVISNLEHRCKELYAVIKDMGLSGERSRQALELVMAVYLMSYSEAIDIDEVDTTALVVVAGNEQIAAELESLGRYIDKFIGVGNRSDYIITVNPDYLSISIWKP